MPRSSSANRKHKYSLITCVNASREMISRFITLRSYDGVAYSCRTIGFIALKAAMTLLLAHLDSRRSETGNLLSHQYQSDRAMIEQVKENMEELIHVSSDALSTQIADWLTPLLAIEADIPDDDQQRCARTMGMQEVGAEVSLPPEEGNDGNGGIIMKLPCFGVLEITRNGMSKDVHIQQHNPQGPHSSPTVPVEAMTPLDSRYSGVGALLISESDCYPGKHSILLQAPSPSATGSNDPHRLQRGLTQHLDVAAAGENWAFQVVDWAFFEKLTRHAGTDVCDPEDAECIMT